MRITVFMEILAFGAALGLAQAPAAAAGATALAAGTRIHAELKTRLDTQHAKVGDAVTAVTSSDVKVDGVKVLPKGSLLEGQVTEVVAAESRKSPSHIAVIFNREVPKKGPPLALQATIAKVVNNLTMGAPDLGMMAPPAMGDAPNPGATNNGGMGRNASLGAEAVPDQVTAANPAIASLARASNGAPISIAMPEPAAPGRRQRVVGSVLSTPQGDLRLDAGTRIELQVLPERPAMGR